MNGNIEFQIFGIKLWFQTQQSVITIQPHEERNQLIQKNSVIISDHVFMVVNLHYIF